MNIYQEVSLAEMENQAVALLGRLHVNLRRISGRITDIEYMRVDPGYCRHVLAYGMQTHNPDTRELCDKLAHLYFDPDGLFNRKAHSPLMERLRARPEPELPAPAAQHSEAPAPQEQAAPPMPHDKDIDSAYVGRLR